MRLPSIRCINSHNYCAIVALASLLMISATCWGVPCVKKCKEWVAWGQFAQLQNGYCQMSSKWIAGIQMPIGTCMSESIVLPPHTELSCTKVSDDGVVMVPYEHCFHRCEPPLGTDPGTWMDANLEEALPLFPEFTQGEWLCLPGDIES